MDTKQGRRTYWEFFAHYPVPAVGWLADRLDSVSCPAAVIWGDRDPYIPFPTARELAERIPHATLTRLRGADHYVMQEPPGEVTDALVRLLDRPVAAE